MKYCSDGRLRVHKRGMKEKNLSSDESDAFMLAFLEFGKKCANFDYEGNGGDLVKAFGKMKIRLKLLKLLTDLGLKVFNRAFEQSVKALLLPEQVNSCIRLARCGHRLELVVVLQIYPNVFRGLREKRTSLSCFRSRGVEDAISLGLDVAQHLGWLQRDSQMINCLRLWVVQRKDHIGVGSFWLCQRVCKVKKVLPEANPLEVLILLLKYE